MITVLGSINMDLVATTARLPKPGETVSGNSFSTAAGGKGANQALAAQRAGAKVRMVGAVGDDPFAAQATAMMHVAAVDMQGVKTSPHPTGTAVILVGGDGENMIAVVPGANGTVSAEDARAAVSSMKRGDYLLVQLEVPPEAVDAALDAAHAKGVVTVINIAPLTDRAAELGRKAHIVIANETEFERLAGQDRLSPDDRIAALKRLHAENGQTIIVTLGAEGVIAIRDGKLHKANGLKIEPVDTVGAGDTFCGYFAASLESGMPFEKALRRAAVAGSLACLKHGAQPSIPMAEDVDRAV
ncbi:ribokinase [Gellertiella hungarica]|uniref:Ribokinase n=1 Tax=Gellertiella hungarica TaxID=1572859 RepID=A0A7W6J332_9HYPH|nr:ribokinase [Gellertiella hungarica]MBB4063822.1 ribokinase [Gellertiella hungarica]